MSERLLSLYKDESIFQGYIGTKTGHFTEGSLPEEICVGDSICFYPKGDRHDIMGGIVTEVNGNFHVQISYPVSLTGIDIVRITKSHKELYSGQYWSNYNGNFKVI
ncbi:hypothetical protein [Gorillibacterium sp. sgz5001074]|uniref:hypothetical protein n=1 Tax=Gorillibacterium sp. sgz5001074 TaxID=3446695 RepID=UPI003F680370